MEREGHAIGIAFAIALGIRSRSGSGVSGNQVGQGLWSRSERRKWNTARSRLLAIDTEFCDDSPRLSHNAPTETAHRRYMDAAKTSLEVGSAVNPEINVHRGKHTPLGMSQAAVSGCLGTESSSRSPRSPRVARLLPLEVQLFFLAFLPSQIRSESRYARRLSERVARLRRLLKQRKQNQTPAFPLDIQLDLKSDDDQMKILVSLQRQSPRKSCRSKMGDFSMDGPRTRLERMYALASPAQQNTDHSDPEQAAATDTASVWELGERALSSLLLSRRRRLFMYAMLLAIILTPARVEGLARWAGELSIRPLAIRHPIFALLSVLLDIYQDLVGTSLIPDDAHWSLFAHVIEVLLLMVAM